MIIARFWLLAALTICTTLWNAVDSRVAIGQAASLEIGDSLPGFDLADFQGKSIRSEDLQGRPVLVFFFGVECPLVRLYASRLNEFSSKFADQEIAWIGINSNRHDSLREIEKFSKETELEFPLLKDPGNKTADDFGATRTPEVFLFDPNHKLCYRGAIDDQYSYGQQRPKAENEFLSDALTSISGQQIPDVQQTEAVGCIIGRIMNATESSKITYSNQISRILQDRCVQCHHSGEIAPFSMSDYEEVVGWAEMIREVTHDRRMPPWHANPEHGHFKNDASLTKAELDLIDQWVTAGAPQGDPQNLPKPTKFVEGWQIGKPDLIVPMAEQPHSVPATGVVPYQHFVVDPGFKEDKWIQAAECRIGNRAVVHHIIVAIHDKKGQKRVHGQLDSEWITATAPGAPPLILPEGFAKLIPAGSKLVFQLHYTPNGTAQTDLSSVGFKFADPSTVRKSVATREASNHDFRIPPHAKNHEVTARYRFRKDALLISLFPHMHLRGKSFRYIATYPDGEKEILLDVPNYDFNWQNGYELANHKRVPAGTILTCVAHYDNSADNFANPDPGKTIRWGDQTWDEMMIGYFDMTLADQDLTKPANRNRTKALLESLSNQKQSFIRDELKQSARESLKTRSKMKQFGLQLRQSFPQIDRVCWTSISAEQLTVRRVAQIDAFREACQSEGVSTDAEGCKLPEIAADDQPVSLSNLKSIDAPDIRFMSSVAQSSFHIPIKIGEAVGTINFWSAEKDAFPKPVQKLLIELVQSAQVNQ